MATGAWSRTCWNLLPFSSSPKFHGLLQCLPESTSHRHTLVFAACVIPRIPSVIVSVFTDTCGSGPPRISRTVRGSFAVNFSTMARSVVTWIERSRAFIFIRKRRWLLNLQPNNLSRELFLFETTRHWTRSKVCSLSARDPRPASANTAKNQSRNSQQTRIRGHFLNPSRNSVKNSGAEASFNRLELRF